MFRFPCQRKIQSTPLDGLMKDPFLCTFHLQASPKSVDEVNGIRDSNKIDIKEEQEVCLMKFNLSTKQEICFFIHFVGISVAEKQ